MTTGIEGSSTNCQTLHKANSKMYISYINDTNSSATEALGSPPISMAPVSGGKKGIKEQHSIKLIQKCISLPLIFDF